MYHHSKGIGLYDNILQNSRSGCAMHTNHVQWHSNIMEHYRTFSVMTALYRANLSALLLDTEWAKSTDTRILNKKCNTILRHIVS